MTGSEILHLAKKYSHDLSGKGVEIAEHTQLGIIPKGYELVHVLIPRELR